MIKKMCLIAVAFAASAGASCNVNVNVNTGTPLDEAIASFIIRRTDGDTNARIEGTVQAGFANVTLTDEQAIQLNGEDLNRVGSLFTATVPADSAYVLRVVEPTRGVESTTIAEPGGFTISTPTEGTAVSLSGFDIEWTNPQADLTVEILITQTLLDESLSLSLGPMTDDGSVTVSDAQIAQAGFGQGANIRISLTRIRKTNNVNGFAVGSLEARLTQTIVVGTAP